MKEPNVNQWVVGGAMPNVEQNKAPDFLRLPRTGKLCPLTGLSRSAINELVLPTPRNNFKPAVRSFVIRKPGARTGIRLVDYADLAAFIRRHQQEPLDGKGSGE